MADRQHLLVVVPGIGGSVLAQPGRPDDVVWDVGKCNIADLVLRPDRMSLDETPNLEPGVMAWQRMRCAEGRTKVPPTGTGPSGSSAAGPGIGLACWAGF
jgi:hypothetical protein